MKYEEMQGLTEEMVIPYLNQNGWSNFPDMKRHILKPHYISIDFADMDHAIGVLAQIAKLTPQALLRKLNLRLRPWPSEAAIEAHKGPWFCFDIESGTACMGRFDGRWFKHSQNHVVDKSDYWARFWPCDAHGNKVPWPEKDGVML